MGGGGGEGGGGGSRSPLLGEAARAVARESAPSVWEAVAERAAEAAVARPWGSSARGSARAHHPYGRRWRRGRRRPWGRGRGRYAEGRYAESFHVVDNGSFVVGLHNGFT